MASKEIKKGTPSENKKSEHTASEVNNKDGMVATNTSTFQPDCTSTMLRKDAVPKAPVESSESSEDLLYACILTNIETSKENRLPIPRSIAVLASLPEVFETEFLGTKKTVYLILNEENFNVVMATKLLPAERAAFCEMAGTLKNDGIDKNGIAKTYKKHAERYFVTRLNNVLKFFEDAGALAKNETIVVHQAPADFSYVGVLYDHISENIKTLQRLHLLLTYSISTLMLSPDAFKDKIQGVYEQATRMYSFIDKRRFDIQLALLHDNEQAAFREIGELLANDGNNDVEMSKDELLEIFKKHPRPCYSLNSSELEVTHAKIRLGKILKRLEDSKALKSEEKTIKKAAYPIPGIYD